MPEVTLEEYKRAYRKLLIERERTAFIVHAIVYAVVNSVLIAANLLIVPEEIWFQYPLIFWGIGVTGHYFEVGRALKNIEKDEMKAESMAKEGSA